MGQLAPWAADTFGRVCVSLKILRQTQTRGKQTAASWPRAAMAERVDKRKLAAGGQMGENWHEKYADCAGRRRLVNYCN